MKITLQGISFKGKYFEEITVDIPQVSDLDHEDADWLISYYISKELGRMIK